MAKASKAAPVEQEQETTAPEVELSAEAKLAVEEGNRIRAELTKGAGGEKKKAVRHAKEEQSTSDKDKKEDTKKDASVKDSKKDGTENAGKEEDKQGATQATPANRSEGVVNDSQTNITKTDK